MQRNETTNLILNETRRRQINTANNDDARNVPQPQQQQQQQQQRNEDGNAAQQIVQATLRTMRANMTATNQLTADGYVPEAAQNGNIITTEGTLLKEGEDGNRSELMSIRSRSSRQSAIGKVIK